MARRRIEIYYDVDNEQLIDSGGSQISPPSISYKEQPLLLLHLVRSDLTAYTGLESDDTFSAAIDEDFDSSTDLMCLTQNSDINVPGDWADVDPANGKLSIRLDAFNSVFKTKISTDRQLTTTYFELQAIPNGDTIISSVFRFPFYCNNLINDGGSVPPEPAEDYYTKTQIDALMLDNPMTAAGDIIVGSVAGNPMRLPRGTNGQFLGLVASVPAWSGPSGMAITVASAAQLWDSNPINLQNAIDYLGRERARVSQNLSDLQSAATARTNLGLGTMATKNIADIQEDIEITDSSKGLILKSPNGSRWRLTVNNDGSLTRTSL